VAISAPSDALPRWDLTTIFPAINSPEFTSAKDEMIRLIDSAEREADRLQAGDGAAAVEHWLGTLTRIREIYSDLESYLELIISADSRDDVAQGALSSLLIIQARITKIRTRFTAWVGQLDVESIIESSELAKDHALVLRKAKVSSGHLMESAQEELAADLTLSGGRAWGRLHNDLTSQIEVPFEREPGQVERLPMSEIRNLAMEADRDLRRRAHEAELAAWKQWETPIAAALNGVKGEHTTLSARRGWNDVLDQALFENHIDRKTLDAMLSAARKAYPDLGRYFAAKARALGISKLAWYDLFAPLSDNDKVWSWDEAVAFLLEQFGSFSPRMRGLAERSIEERWIDAGPRPGKVGGAFCQPIGKDASRVLMNYTPAFDGVSTLAHELGHAYHNLAIAGRPLLQKEETPMTLAETASTFCETILRKAAIAQGTPDEALTILEGALQDAAQIVVDISSRFLFEQAVFARRSERVLSAAEFCELMLQAQRDTYGNGLDPEQLHPYMWAVKGHYYSLEYPYYNYPYMFGLLFGLGLYAQYEKDPERFKASYDELLASTGEADAATLAARFGIDIQSEAFWNESLNVIREDIDEFVRLVDRKTA
jgi:pepF/M3 family oligoendopeptidase